MFRPDTAFVAWEKMFVRTRNPQAKEVPVKLATLEEINRTILIKTEDDGFFFIC